jgi:phosphoglycolate phosphatase-like HAD superfamily hydrolase
MDADPPRSFSVGDHLHDVELARDVGGRGVHLLTGHGARHPRQVPGRWPLDEIVC